MGREGIHCVDNVCYYFSIYPDRTPHSLGDYNRIHDLDDSSRTTTVQALAYLKKERKEMKIKLVFDDWRDFNHKSIYSTAKGISLSMGDFHSGSTFNATIEVSSPKELEEYIKQRYYPVFYVASTIGPDNPIDKRAETYKVIHAIENILEVSPHSVSLRKAHASLVGYLNE